MSDFPSIETLCRTYEAGRKTYESHSGYTEAETSQDNSDKPETTTVRRTISEMPINAVLGTAARYDALCFDTLKHYFPHLQSVRDFVTSPDYIGDTEITFQCNDEQLSASDLMAGLDKVFQAVISHMGKT